jgi:hypothetical protein
MTMCPKNLLADQLLHSAGLALALAAFALLALGLDLWAAKLKDLGASEDTVDSMRRAASILLKLDLAALVMVAAAGLVRCFFCLVGL